MAKAKQTKKQASTKVRKAAPKPASPKKPSAKKGAKQSVKKRPAKAKPATVGRKTAKAPAKSKSPTKPKAPVKAAKPTRSKSAPAASSRSAIPPPAAPLPDMDGDQAVMAYMESVKPQLQDIVRTLDHLIDTTVPNVVRAIKWKAPFYGLPGKGWIVTVAAFKQYVSIGFFAGAHMNPVPPEGDKGNMRRYHLRSLSDLDEHQMRSWLQQASQMQGWGQV